MKLWLWHRLGKLASIPTPEKDTDMNPNDPGYDYGGRPPEPDPQGQFPLYAVQLVEPGQPPKIDHRHLYWDRDIAERHAAMLNRAIQAGVVLWEPVTLYARGHGSIMIIPDTVSRNDIGLRPLVLRGKPDDAHNVATVMHRALHGSLAANILIDFHNERLRAHAKHADTSMEQKPWDDSAWGDVVGEELGEIHRARNEYRHGNLTLDEYKAKLREELVQLGAMSEAWTAAIDDTQLTPITPIQLHHTGEDGPSDTMRHPNTDTTPQPDTTTTTPPTTHPEFIGHTIVNQLPDRTVRGNIHLFLRTEAQRRRCELTDIAPHVKLYAHQDYGPGAVIKAVNDVLGPDWSDTARLTEYEWAVEIRDVKTVMVGPRVAREAEPQGSPATVFAGNVTRIGGGEVTISMDRDTMRYPGLGKWVVVREMAGSDSWVSYDESIDGALANWEAMIRGRPVMRYVEHRRADWEWFVDQVKAAGFDIKLEPVR